MAAEAEAEAAAALDAEVDSCAFDDGVAGVGARCGSCSHTSTDVDEADEMEGIMLLMPLVLLLQLLLLLDVFGDGVVGGGVVVVAFWGR